MRHAPGIGQVIEWLVWAALAARSDDALHVFLPLHDMGVDGVVHRRGTQRLTPVQVKGRTHLEDGVLRLHVQVNEAADDAVLVIGGLVDLTTPALTEPVLAIDAGTLRAIAPRVPYGPREAYSIEIPWPPGGRTHWRGHCVTIDDLVARLAGAAPDAGGTARVGAGAFAIDAALEAAAAEGALDPLAIAPQERTGMVAEAEFVRRVCDEPAANVFRAFPDDAFAEYLVRDCAGGAMLAVQVKCRAVDDAGATLLPVEFRAGAPPWARRAAVVVFGMRAGGDLLDRCMVVPAAALGGMLRPAPGGLLGIDVSLAAGGRWIVARDAIGRRLLELTRETGA